MNDQLKSLWQKRKKQAQTNITVIYADTDSFLFVLFTHNLLHLDALFVATSSFFEELLCECLILYYTHRVRARGGILEFQASGHCLQDRLRECSRIRSNSSKTVIPKELLITSIAFREGFA